MNRIKKLRLERDWTQERLGKELNVKGAAISKYESGSIPLTGENIRKLCEVFSVSSDYLLGITDIPNNELIEKYLDVIVSEIERIFSYSEEIPIEGDDNYSDSLTNLSKTEKIAAIHSVLKDIKEVNGDLELDFYLHDTPSTDKNLMGASDIKNPYSDKNLTTKDEKDIAKDLENTLNRLEGAQDGLMFDGEALDDETRELLKISLENSMRLAKQIAKKYTPNKYKK